MKKSIVRQLLIIILASVLVSMGLNYATMVWTSYQEILTDSKDLFWQIQQVLHQNQEATEQTKENFAADCLVRAKAAAYFVQNHPEMLENQAEMKKVARLLQVDEFHIFNKEGTLYAGSEPKYFGLNFASGEQMQYFLPMLEDLSLELCQDITPNTAESKLMQYAAVWCENGEAIVQIGMEPERVLRVMEKNELSYIFSLITVNEGAEIYAIDRDTHEVLGALEKAHVGETAEKLGLRVSGMTDSNRLYTMEIDGRKRSCAFETTGSLILVWTCDRAALFENANYNTLWLVGYLVILSAVIILSILFCLDKYIIQSIYRINRDLEKITDGNLDVELPAQPTPELTALSSRVNVMVKSILDTTNKMSLVLQQIKLPIAVYEYNRSMQRVRVTSRMKQILCLEDKDERLFLDYKSFNSWMDEIRSHPVNDEGNVFRLPGEEEHFVRIESFDYDKSVLGIVIDVTDSMQKRRQIEQERDIDLLTGLYNRRAFYNQLQKLMDSGQEFGKAAIVMMDADNLKKVNDAYGHESGDRYLRAIAEILCGIRQTKESKLVARLSGDEFVMFLYGYESMEQLCASLEEMEAEKERSTILLEGGVRIPVSFSIGCAFYPEDEENMHSLMGLADERMYENKRKGKQEAVFKDSGRIRSTEREAQ